MFYIFKCKNKILLLIMFYNFVCLFVSIKHRHIFMKVGICYLKAEVVFLTNTPHRRSPIGIHFSLFQFLLLQAILQ